MGILTPGGLETECEHGTQLYVRWREEERKRGFESSTCFFVVTKDSQEVSFRYLGEQNVFQKTHLLKAWFPIGSSKAFRKEVPSERP